MTVIAINRTATVERIAPAWADLLSPRETEVLHLIAAGRNNAEIAADLFISVPTVKTHVAQVLRKTRARDRVTLVVLSYTSGFVAAPETEAAARASARPCRARLARQHVLR